MRPTAAETAELRRMLAELDEMQYTPRTWNRIEYGPGQYDIVAGNANAPVYQDITEGHSPTPAHTIRRLLRAYLAGGRYTVWFPRALRVARLRLQGSRYVSEPILPVEAGQTPRQRLRIARQTDDPIYAQFAADVDTLAREDHAYWHGEA